MMRRLKAALNGNRTVYEILRGSVRVADTLSLWDPQGRPRGLMAALVAGVVYQSARYMNNGPVSNPDPGVEGGAFDQVQARFKKTLKEDTRVVVAHSLGTVIAYEGLCSTRHNVDTFVTIGSPIATPYLILEPLRQRLRRLVDYDPGFCLPWPGVRRWVNFYAPADVWSVPVKKLAGIFGGQAGKTIEDIEVVHGNPSDFVETHKLTSYLKHPEISEVIAEALQR